MVKTAIGKFRYMDGSGMDDGSLWIVHNLADGESYCGEFRSDKEAEAACLRWANAGAEVVRIKWTAPPANAPDSDRGEYLVYVEGSRWKKRATHGWGAMESAARISRGIREAIVKHGLQAVIETLNAASAE